METVLDWEKRNGKEYPEWAAVWHYDAYGESWTTQYWFEVKDFYKEERLGTGEHSAMWEYYYEPMVCLPTDVFPECGSGKRLQYKGDN